MRNTLIPTIIASAVFCAILPAQDAPKLKSVPVRSTSPVSGEQMFTTYCAVCHGKDGRGGGPAAAALKKAPADLTQLTIRNNGVFPEDQVMQSINGPEPITAHGTREMPVWSDLFKSMGNDRAIVRLRLVNLTDFIKSIQRN